MLKRIDKPLGKLIDSIKNPDGTTTETYELEILGTICRYTHFAEFEETTEMKEPFTGNTIILS